MLKDLFNSRWFIATLAVGSILLVLHSVAVPLLSEPEFADAEPIVEDYLSPDSYDTGGSVVAKESVAAPHRIVARSSGGSVLDGRLTWNDDPLRDPFRARGVAVPDGQAIVPRITRAVAGDTALPRLDALVAGTISRFAVLDDQVVREGDHIGDFRVMRIGPNGVRVNSAIKSVWIPVSRTSKD